MFVVKGFRGRGKREERYDLRRMLCAESNNIAPTTTVAAVHSRVLRFSVFVLYALSAH